MDKTTLKEKLPVAYEEHDTDPRTLETMGDANAGKILEHSEIIAWVDGLDKAENKK